MVRRPVSADTVASSAEGVRFLRRHQNPLTRRPDGSENGGSDMNERLNHFTTIRYPRVMCIRQAYDSVYSPQGKLDGISHPTLFGEILSCG